MANTLTATLPKLVLNTTPPGNVSIELPVILLDATSNTGNVYITLPVVKVSGSMRMDTTGIGEITLPIQTLSGFGAGIVDVTFPIITLVANGTTVSTGSATISLPIIKLLVSGITGVVGNALVTLPIVQISGTGHDVIGGTLSVSLPKIELLAQELAKVYKCVVINLFNGVITEYTNFSFDKFVDLNGTIYGINSSGIYALTGDNDNGTGIDATIQPFNSSFGTTHLKNIQSCLLGMETSGKLKVTPLYEDFEGTSQNIVGVPDKLLLRRAKLGLGKSGQFVGVKVQNVNGVDFNLDSITFDLNIKKRRINE